MPVKNLIPKNGFVLFLLFVSSFLVIDVIFQFAIFPFFQSYFSFNLYMEILFYFVYYFLLAIVSYKITFSKNRCLYYKDVDNFVFRVSFFFPSIMGIVYLWRGENFTFLVIRLLLSMYFIYFNKKYIKIYQK